MSDLIERLGKAVGPDKELDWDLALLAGWERRDWDIASANLGWFAPGVPNVMHSDPPRYTASIDAALTLVPDGWAWAVREHRDCPPPHSDALAKVSRVAWGCPEGELYEQSQARHPTPAIALCIAALRARTPEGAS